MKLVVASGMHLCCCLVVRKFVSSLCNWFNHSPMNFLQVQAQRSLWPDDRTKALDVEFGRCSCAVNKTRELLLLSLVIIVETSSSNIAIKARAHETII